MAGYTEGVAPDYDNDVEFLRDYSLARNGDRDAMHRLWGRLGSKLRVTKEDPGLAYLTLYNQVDKFDPARVPYGKAIRWSFASWLGHRIRAGIQQQHNLLSYPVKVNNRVRYGEWSRDGVEGAPRITCCDASGLDLADCDMFGEEDPTAGV